MIRVVIVDDEPLARERLRTLVLHQEDVAVVAECGDGLAALDAVEQHKPDLLFLDIQMPEMDGFEVLQSIGDAQPPAVIFVTAYDQYALRAFEVAAVDYLLKPIDPERFGAAVQRAREKLSSPAAKTGGADAAVSALLAQLQMQQRYRTRFAVRTGDQVSFVRVDDVEWIEATGNYARLFAAGRTYIIRETMKSVEAGLDPVRFLRIHRSAIVQIDCITSMEPHFHGEWAITMRNGTRFTSSRSYNEKIRELIR